MNEKKTSSKSGEAKSWEVFVENIFGGDPAVICPYCHSAISVHAEGHEYEHWNYCPNCGKEVLE